MPALLKAATSASLHLAKVLYLQGLPVVPAPEEAEAVMAALELAGLVDACATGDGDALVFGSTQVYHILKLQVSCGWTASSVRTYYALPVYNDAMLTFGSCCSICCQPPVSALLPLPCCAVRCSASIAQ